MEQEIGELYKQDRTAFNTVARLDKKKNIKIQGCVKFPWGKFKQKVLGNFIHPVKISNVLDKSLLTKTFFLLN